MKDKKEQYDKLEKHFGNDNASIATELDSIESLIEETEHQIRKDAAAQQVRNRDGHIVATSRQYRTMINEITTRYFAALETGMADADLTTKRAEGTSTAALKKLLLGEETNNQPTHKQLKVAKTRLRTQYKRIGKLRTLLSAINKEDDTYSYR